MPYLLLSELRDTFRSRVARQLERMALFRLFFVFVVRRHERRRIAHFGVTATPTAAWVVRQITTAGPAGQRGEDRRLCPGR